MRLIGPSSKLMSRGGPIKKGPMRTMTTTMEPSATRLLSSSSSSSAEDAGDQAVPSIQLPQAHPEDPLLHLIPTDLYPSYRPIPVVGRIVVALLSAWISAATTWKCATWLQPLVLLRGLKPVPSIGEMLGFLAKTIVLTALVQNLLQDIFLPPSRISMRDLCLNYFLPSSISEYTSISVPDSKGVQSPVGVHYMKYLSKSKSSSRFDAVYVHHGFGASSLSWLPTLPSLVDRLGGRVGLGHDMVGFGFTDRKEELEWYTTDASARISKAVLEQETINQPTKSVLLLGHSLGALGVLKMARLLPESTSKVVILCAPALGISHRLAKEAKPGDSASWLRRRFLNPLSSMARKGIVGPSSGYILKRVVGLKNSWRMGLERGVWGDPKKVRDSDVLRYQWPSIGEGWERGLLNFARAQKQHDDKELLRSVMELPNTRLAIVLGEKDKVIPVQQIDAFMEGFGDFDGPIIQLKGLGHNAFEEDVEAFLQTVEGILEVDMTNTAEESYQH